jgi:hypothetical protein
VFNPINVIQVGLSARERFGEFFAGLSLRQPLVPDSFSLANAKLLNQ